MNWAYYLLLVLTALTGLVFTAFTLPGLWLILGAAAAYAWLTGGAFLGVKILIALLVLAGGAEVGEFALGGAGAKKAGASAWGVAGGLVGGVVGGFALTGVIPIYVLGTVIGICLGTFIGASGVELLLGRPVYQSLRIGLGAAKGKLAGIVGKVAVGLAMLLVVVVKALPVGWNR